MAGCSGVTGQNVSVGREHTCRERRDGCRAGSLTQSKTVRSTWEILKKFTCPGPGLRNFDMPNILSRNLLFTGFHWPWKSLKDLLYIGGKRPWKSLRIGRSTWKSLNILWRCYVCNYLFSQTASETGKSESIHPTLDLRGQGPWKSKLKVGHLIPISASRVSVWRVKVYECAKMHVV